MIMIYTQLDSPVLSLLWRLRGVSVKFWLEEMQDEKTTRGQCLPVYTTKEQKCPEPDPLGDHKVFNMVLREG